MADEESAPTITDSETTIEDNSVTVIVETPPEPVVEPETEPDSPTLETVLAMITALAADVASLRGDMAGINARLDNAESAQATDDSNFSDTIESAPAAEPEPDSSPVSSHFWFRSVG